MAVAGRPTDEQCFTAWEELLKKNSKATGNLSYLNYFNLVKSYALLIAKYNLVRACLLKLACVVDATTITLVTTQGYKIDVSSTKAYALSLDRAMRASGNLTTKITTKQKQMDAFHGSDDNAVSIGKIVANTNAALKYRAIDIDVLLSEYNEYSKLIKRMQHGERGRNK
jgi:hypothetical protein